MDTAADKPWRREAEVLALAHPEFPDDVPVVVHCGGPRITSVEPEVVWVTLLEMPDHNLYRGRLLNTPHHLPGLAEGQEILFRSNSAGAFLQVTPEYMAEREQWLIRPCDGCGSRELMDPPSKLFAVIFANSTLDNWEIDGFTTFCPFCGGVHVVENKATLADRAEVKWWQFWKWWSFRSRG